MASDRMKFDTEVVKWSEVKATIAKHQPHLSELINLMPGVDQFPLIRTRHAYGEPVLKEGKLHLPIKGKLRSYDDPIISQEIKELLDYHWVSVPFGFLTHNTTASVIHSFSHDAPYRMFTTGSFYSLISIFEDRKPNYYVPSLYSINSGCQSLLLLPQVSDMQRNQLLHDKYATPEVKYPKSFTEQSELLKSLCLDSRFQTDWCSETLFLSKHFFEKNQHTLPFFNYLLRATWDAQAATRHPAVYDILWATFVERFVAPQLGSLYKRSTTHVVSIVKHLVNMALGNGAGFIPAINDSTGPISKLIDLYIDDYKIRSYHPTIMTIDGYDGKTPTYYSMQRPLFSSPELELSNAPQTVKELVLIREILCRFQDAVVNNHPKLGMNLKGSILPEVLARTHFDFYHPQAKIDSSVSANIEAIFEQDPRFDQVHRVKTEPHLKRPLSSLFFKGCIRIQPQKKG